MGLGLPEAFASNVWTTTRPTDGPPTTDHQVAPNRPAGTIPSVDDPTGVVQGRNRRTPTLRMALGDA